MSRKHERFLLGLAVLAVLAAAMAAIYAESRLARLVVGGLGESFSTKVYAAPYIIEDGSPVWPEKILERLSRLGYRPGNERPLEAGYYLWRSPRLEVHLRGFRTPWLAQETGLYKLSWDENRWFLSDSQDAAVPLIALEPEVASELSGAHRIRREPSGSGEIPENLKKAVVASEDKRFYSHWGVDFKAVVRALWANAAGGRTGLQGGSTITQQLSKNLFLTPRRTLGRKAAEAALALYLEWRYSKDEILTLYLNHIYLGQDGPVSVSGVRAGRCGPSS